MPGQFLTVHEAAELLRVTTTTVYRWCRAGRLGAEKLGGVWRIPAGEIAGGVARPRAATVATLEELIATLWEDGHHVLALACHELSVSTMEADICRAAWSQQGAVVYLGWGEREEEVRQRLRPALGGRLLSDVTFQFIDLASAYELGGTQDVAELVAQTLAARAGRGGRSWLYGEPLRYFGLHYQLLAACERALHEAIQGHSATLVCGYSLSRFFQARSVALLMDLVHRHSAVLLFDGQRALLYSPLVFGGIGL